MSGLSYLIQSVIQVLGSKMVNHPSNSPQLDPTFALTRATLTATYAGNVSSPVKISGMSQVVFNVSYVAGTNPSLLNLKFEFSDDEVFIANVPVTWYQETAESTSTTTTTEYLVVRKFDNNAALVGGTTYTFRISIPVAEHYMRVSAQETLTSGVGFGSIYIETIISGR